MANPVANSVSPPPGGTELPDKAIPGLIQGSSWQFAGARTLTYSLDLNYDGASQAWPAEWIAALRRAFDYWEAVANIRFVQVGGIGAQTQNQSTADLAIALIPGEGQGVIAGLGFFPDPNYVDRLLSAGGFSRTSGAFPYPQPEGDIVFDNTFPQFESLNDGSSGFRILVHEIGHALGLKHTDDDGGNGRPTFGALGVSQADSTKFTVMSNNDPRGLTGSVGHTATPMGLDIAAIQYIYGANTAYHTGDDVYRFVEDNAYRTIWDADGTDTIDGSASSSALAIEMRPGLFTTRLDAAFDPRTAVGIAYGVVIERAIGSAANDRITGNSASNWIDGGAGADEMHGLEGDDTYVVDNAGDTIFEFSGTDTVISSVSFVLNDSQLENLILGGSASINGTGNFHANRITGNGAANVLTGNGGEDVLDGGGGADTMVGGRGNTTYVVDNVGDVVVENTNEGVDTVQSYLAYVLGANLENLTLLGGENLNATGNAGNNTIRGNSGSNRLIGGVGVDRLEGAEGNDTYVVDASDIYPSTYISLLGEPGVYVLNGEQRFLTGSDGTFDIAALRDADSNGVPEGVFLRFLSSTSSWSFDFSTLRLGIPFQVGTFLNAERSAFATSGHPGLDVGGEGRGSNSVAGSFTVSQFAYSGSTLQSLVVSFEQHGDGVAAALFGTLSFNGPSTGPADTVVELAGGGTDTVESGLSLTLPDHVENLTLTGSANNYGTGNAEANVLSGTSGRNDLVGLARDDVLAGNAGDDTLRGGSNTVSFNTNGSRAKLGDLDGDGKVDILQIEASGRMRGWHANGSGFDNQTVWGWGSRPQDQMADLSGDRRADVVQLHENGNIYVWTSNGTGFNAYDVWGRGSRPTDKLADFNGDGRADLVQLHENGNLYVWTSTGTGFNAYDVWGRGSRPTDQIADFNGDGRADVAQLHENGNIYVWTSNGTGFNAYDVWGRGSRPTDKLADFNGDGKADVVQLHENGNMYVWTSNGSGFNAYDVWGRGSRPTDQLADVNGDGRADVVQLHENGNIYVWTSNGHGFNDYTVWGRGARPTDQLADVNGDGKADVVQLHENGNAYVWLSTGTSFADYRVLATGSLDGGGNDTFVFGPGFGHDIVRDFESGPGAGDVLQFAPSVFNSFGAVMSHAVDDGSGNVLITYDSANSVLIEHMRLSQLAADDFRFA